MKRAGSWRETRVEEGLLMAVPHVLIYTRDFCGYCSAAKALLSAKGVAFEERNASKEPGIPRRDDPGVGP